MNQFVKSFMIPYCCEAPVLLIVLFFLACSPDGVTPVLTVGGGSVTTGNNAERKKINQGLQKLKEDSFRAFKE